MLEKSIECRGSMRGGGGSLLAGGVKCLVRKQCLLIGRGYHLLSKSWRLETRRGNLSGLTKQLLNKILTEPLYAANQLSACYFTAKSDTLLGFYPMSNYWNFLPSSRLYWKWKPASCWRNDVCSLLVGKYGLYQGMWPVFLVFLLYFFCHFKLNRVT